MRIFWPLVLLLAGCPLGGTTPPTESACPAKPNCGQCASLPVCIWCASPDADERGCRGASQAGNCNGTFVTTTPECPADVMGGLPE